MIKVIGIGSPFGNDALGIECINILNKDPALHSFIPNHLTLIKADRPGLHLVNLIQGAKTVFLIDAVLTDDDNRRVIRLENKAIEQVKSCWSSHQFGVGQALSMARQLHQLPEKIVLYGIKLAAHKNELTQQLQHELLSLL